MATLKAIRKRIGSIRNTQQITKAMKMVAAAKLRRAQEAAVEALAGEITEKAIGRFIRGETDAVYILYSRFRSALSQVPTLEKLLPVTVPETGYPEQLTEYLYEPSIEALLASLLPKVAEVAVFRALLEATASEHGARMTAMDSATSNASKMM